MSGPAPESTLGRYVPRDAAGGLVPVRLLRLPVRLLLASREHHDGLVRELRLVSLRGRLDGAGHPDRLVELAEELVDRHGGARPRRDGELEAAVARGQDVIDLLEHVPAAAADVVGAVSALVEECDGFCEAGRLMTLPRHPLVRRFGSWYLGEYREQVRGAAPTPWDGPLRLSEPSG